MSKRINISSKFFCHQVAAPKKASFSKKLSNLELWCLLVSWAWWDWPLTSLTIHRPSVLWHCWLGHLTCKIVSEMTYNVSSGTLSSTIPPCYHYTEPATIIHTVLQLVLVLGNFLSAILHFWSRAATTGSDTSPLRTTPGCGCSLSGLCPSNPGRYACSV